MDRDQAGVLGRRVLRVEDERLLTVGGTYVDDVQVPELTRGRLRPWSARLFYAYADALLAAGRADEARDAFARAAQADHRLHDAGRRRHGRQGQLTAGGGRAGGHPRIRARQPPA